MAEGKEGLVGLRSSEDSLVAYRDDFFFRSVFTLAMIARFGPLGLFLMAHPRGSETEKK